MTVERRYAIARVRQVAALLFAYAIGKVVNGFIADRVSAKNKTGDSPQNRNCEVMQNTELCPQWSWAARLTAGARI